MSAPPTLQLRLAEPADAPVLASLLAELAPQAPPTIAQVVQVLSAMRAYPRFVCWLGERAGEAVGTYTLLLCENLAHPTQPAAIVESVVVASAHRRQGIGTALMQHALAQAAAAGCSKLALSSNLRRREAHAFYEALGFRRHGYSFLATPPPVAQPPEADDPPRSR